MAQAPARQPVSTLEDFARRCFEAVGMNAADAALVADTLIAAEVRGVTSHGLIRLPAYLQNLRDGVVEPRSRPAMVAEGPAVALVDGRRAMGQVASKMAMDLAIARARTSGIAAVTVRNSNHFGAGAYWAMLALPHRMIGIAMTNGAVAMAPTGGVTPLIGNNPLAVASPAGSELPIVLDMAQTMVARGWIKLAALRGQPLPDGWAQDARGGPTNDPNAALNGSLLPIGGYKGYGLSVIVELLTAVLSGAALGPALENMGFTVGQVETKRYPAHDVGGAGTGHFFMALDIARFMPFEEYASRVDALIETMKMSERAEGVSDILLPGEREFAAERARRSEGVTVTPELADQLARATEITGVQVQ
ncbi:MAG: Ldh family oxidoreductase [Chloroflexi bacterium]|nr:Ldh family oxidoreductase [Chloroflexota bacterium]